jgi:hypothetical protein
VYTLQSYQKLFKTGVEVNYNVDDLRVRQVNGDDNDLRVVHDKRNIKQIKFNFYLKSD